MSIPAAIADDGRYSESCGRVEVADGRAEQRPVLLQELDIPSEQLRPDCAPGDPDGPDEPQNNDCDDDDEQPGAKKKMFQFQSNLHTVPDMKYFL